MSTLTKQEEFLKQFDSASFQYKKNFEFKIYDENQINITVSTTKGEYKCYILGLQNLKIDLYDLENSQNTKKIINYLFTTIKKN